MTGNEHKDHSRAVHHHHHHADEQVEAIPCAVLTISDSRTNFTDDSGKIIMHALKEAGHAVEHYEILKDETDAVHATIDKLLNGNVSVLITNGSTGVGGRDIVIEAMTPLLDKRLDGFGQLFRQLSYEEIGSAAIMTRALGGTARGKIVFCLPGSPNACTLAMEKLILPELKHLVWLVR